MIDNAPKRKHNAKSALAFQFGRVRPGWPDQERKHVAGAEIVAGHDMPLPEGIPNEDDSTALPPKPMRIA